jgi:hypothetical protein
MKHTPKLNHDGKEGEEKGILETDGYNIFHVYTVEGGHHQQT